ncbi:MAG: AAA family ATPase [Acidobacteria bacterium]|nr:AAA family ATPase [Acidobacteriota bacterium]
MDPQAGRSVSPQQSALFPTATGRYARLERGASTLFLAVGLAEWKAGDGGRDTAAPVLLVPIEAISRGGHGSRWLLRRRGDTQVNDVLVHALETDHGVSVAPDALVGLVRGEDEGEALDLEPVFARLKQAAGAVPGFDIKERWVIGNFAFQKLAIVKDLRELAEALARNNLIAGIAGDDEARGHARGARASVDPSEFDRSHPDNEFLILDADSSQQQAIAAALGGQNGVISGPPGTGKSQTIANLIAELVSRGKTVLFVAEKRAALDVVKNRLSDLELAHLCLDCHGAETSRRMVAQQLQESLNLIRDAMVPDTAQAHATFVERRQRLNQHVASMHTARLAAGLSLYQMYGRLLRLPEGAQSQARLARRTVQTITGSDVDEGCELLREAAFHADLVTGDSPSAWVGAVFADEEAVRRTIERARRVAGSRWTSCEASLDAVVSEAGVKRPRTIGDLRVLVQLLTEIEGLQSVCWEHVFALPLDALVTALRPARSVTRRWWAALFSPTFRRALRDVRAVCHEGKITPAQALALVELAKTLLGRWWAVTSAVVLPCWSHDCEALVSAWTALVEDLKGLLQAFPLRRLDNVQLSGLGNWLRDLAEDGVTPAQLLRLGEIERRLAELGLTPLWEDIRQGKPAPELWPERLRHVWLTSSIEEVQLSEPSTRLSVSSASFVEGLGLSRL